MTNRNGYSIDEVELTRQALWQTVDLIGRACFLAGQSKPPMEIGADMTKAAEAVHHALDIIDGRCRH